MPIVPILTSRRDITHLAIIRVSHPLSMPVLGLNQVGIPFIDTCLAIRKIVAAWSLAHDAGAVMDASLLIEHAIPNLIRERVLSTRSLRDAPKNKLAMSIIILDAGPVAGAKAETSQNPLHVLTPPRHDLCPLRHTMSLEGQCPEVISVRREAGVFIARARNIISSSMHEI